MERSDHGLIQGYYNGICLMELRKTIKTLSQDSWSVTRNCVTM